MPDLASSHSTTAVRALLAAGVPVDTRGENGATALHWACWKGYADIVKILLERRLADGGRHNVPWHACRLVRARHPQLRRRSGNYAEVARELIAARAAFPIVDFPSGHAEVDRILREHGIV